MIHSATLTCIMFVLFAHFICDYILQTRAMGKNKHHSLKQLTYHVLAYSTGLTILLMLGNYFNFGGQLTAIGIVEYVGINFGLHFVTDYITSKQIHRLWNSGMEYQTFVVMGFDQFVHMACLVGTLQLLF